MKIMWLGKIHKVLFFYIYILIDLGCILVHKTKLEARGEATGTLYHPYMIFFLKIVKTQQIRKTG